MKRALQWHFFAAAFTQEHPLQSHRTDFDLVRDAQDHGVFFVKKPGIRSYAYPAGDGVTGISTLVHTESMYRAVNPAVQAAALLLYP